MFELFTGLAPFQSEFDKAIYEERLKTPTMPSRIWPEKLDEPSPKLTEHIRRIMEWCWTSNPKPMPELQQAQETMVFQLVPAPEPDQAT